MKLKYSVIPLLLLSLAVGMYFVFTAGRMAVERLVPDRDSETLASSEASGASELSNALNQSVSPAIFRIISERNNLLNVRGIAEAGVVLSILGNNERLQQIRVDDDGVWEAEIDVSNDPVLGLSLTMFLEGSQRVNGDELLLRIMPPNKTPDTSLNEPIESQSPLILLTAPGGPSRVILTPFGRLPSNQALTLGPIEYDDLGGVIFSGFATRVGRVRVFGDGELIGESRVSADGRWFLIAGETLPLTPYKIRVELQEPDGNLSDIRVGFQRLPPNRKSDVSPYVLFSEDVWHVRRNLVGGGVQYTAIFSPDAVNTETTAEEALQ
ncbi:MAG: hypothetical protein ABJ275_06310 [Maricaulaceae bacterium]